MQRKQKISLDQMYHEITHIRGVILEKEQTHRDLIEKVQPHFTESARNLLHYMTLRTFDLRELQDELSSLAISSLGHSEGYTMVNIHNILVLLQLINGKRIDEPLHGINWDLNFYRSREQLRINTATLFGGCEKPGCTNIMVTMPTEAAYNFRLIEDLIHSGMNIARINTSHDTMQEWDRMIRHIEATRETTGKDCKIYMDLAGPKLRTGPLKMRRKRDKIKPGIIKLFKDDVLELHREPIEGVPAVRDFDGNVLVPAKCSTTLPEVLDDVRIGHPICFDDGKIIGKIEEIKKDKVLVRITNAGPEGSRLGGDKGINLPDTHLNLPSLTAADLEALPFLVNHADMVGFSFVRTPKDVEVLQRELGRIGRPDMGIILKVETKEAFSNLPMLLLTAMRSPKVGVMIARGDLAVEIGFERIAEVQEEILWICEAAHIPNIWATQVLEKLAKKGIATRAEITDAAMSNRAECVMLNKGPYIKEAVKALNDITHRMSTHQFKRKSNLRPLEVARKFLQNNAPSDEGVLV